jgi:hypothetical protein
MSPVVHVRVAYPGRQIERNKDNLKIWQCFTEVLEDICLEMSRKEATCET